MLFKSKEFISGLFFLGFGLFVIFQTMELTIWSESEPGPGFFPLITGFLIAGFSSTIIIRFLISTKIPVKEKISEETEKEAEGEMNYVRVSAYILLILLYGLFLEKVGYLIITAVFLLLILRYVEKQTWKRSTILTFTGIAAIYLIFVYFLTIQLPKGLITWL